MSIFERISTSWELSFNAFEIPSNANPNFMIVKRLANGTIDKAERKATFAMAN